MPRRFFRYAVLALTSLAAPAAAQLSTTATDFDQPGTQPGGLTDALVGFNQCASCHGNYDEAHEPFERWSGGMMANSMRDPIFHAALTIANQDAGDAGSFCFRCHSPGGWLNGRATPADGSALIAQDYEGVGCSTCHRLVDPVFEAANPAVDSGILAALANAPTSSHNGQYVVDPEDRRRGPFDLGLGFPYHDWLESPYHQEAQLCSTCHEVSNPLFTRSGGATPSASDAYVLNATNTEHPTGEKEDMFPIERTFTEWALSDFAAGPVDMGGRFGGNKTMVSSCQDCHMPDSSGTACNPGLGGATRSDLPQHSFLGANSWVPLAVYALDQSLALYPANFTNGQPLSVFQDVVDRNKAFLAAASDLHLSRSGSDLVVRVINQTGHKLPTGYGEGRRMWVNVRFLGLDGSLLGEHGHYDAATATLTTGDTKVYETKHGLDAAMASATGLPAGESFHFALNNTIVKDNRIPPRGFDNAAFEAGQAQPVGATYADGQYWDETVFPIPARTYRAVVSVYHQTTSREYIEFLRDENTTDSNGQIAYDQWVDHGKSAPVLMDRKVLRIQPGFIKKP